MPHEIEAAAAAEAQAAADAARAAAVSDIPSADAPWDEIQQFMARVQQDIDSGAMASWQANGNQRAEVVDRRCPQWALVGRSKHEESLITKFHQSFKIAAFSFDV